MFGLSQIESKICFWLFGLFGFVSSICGVYCEPSKIVPLVFPQSYITAMLFIPSGYIKFEENNIHFIFLRCCIKSHLNLKN
jgi:hypothetical protein